MRRLIVLITAATLCGLAASAQEVSSEKGTLEVNATARFDANPYFPLQKGAGEFDFSFSNTSIYTFIDGEFGKGFSYSISNHWLGVDWSLLSPDDKLTPLYKNSFHSDESTWLDWATLTYTLETENAGAWDFTVGKDVMAYALTEYDANDVDCHFDLSSKFWNENSAYQWGASIGWAAPNECSSLKLQVTSSPYRPDEIVMTGDRIYTDTAMAYNAGAVGVLVLSGETTLETARKVAADEAACLCAVKGSADKTTAGRAPAPEFHAPDFVVPDISVLCDLLVANRL